MKQGALYFSFILFLVVIPQHVDCKGGSSSEEEESDITVEGEGGAFIGGTYRVTCSVTKGIVPQAVSWYQGDNLIYVDDGIVWKRKNVQVTKDDFRKTGSHWLEIKLAHSTDATIYKCLVITVGGDILTGEYRVTLDPDSIKVKRGTVVSLHCNRSGSMNEIGNIFWKKDSILITADGNLLVKDLPEIQLSGLALVFNVTASTTGTYVCYNDGEPVQKYDVSFYGSAAWSDAFWNSAFCSVLSKHLFPTYEQPIENETFTDNARRFRIIEKQPALQETKESALSGWRGYAFGAALAVIILFLLIMANFIQNRHNLPGPVLVK